MTTGKDKLKEDNPAVDGLLQEYAAGGREPDRELIQSIMAGVAETEMEPAAPPRPEPVVLNIPHLKPIAALLAISVAILWLVTRPEPIAKAGGPLQVDRGGKVRTLDKGDPLFAEDQIIGGDNAIVKFPDGSTAQVREDSLLLINKPGDNERVSVELINGHALFRAARSEKRFRVNAGVPVDVIGTVFGVHRNAQDATVHVYSGIVQVGDITGVSLERGESAITVPDGSVLFADIDPDQALAWAREKKGFADKPLKDVAAWLRRNSSYDFRIAPTLLDQAVSANFGPDTDIRSEIEAMLTAQGLTFIIEGRTVHITTE